MKPHPIGLYLVCVLLAKFCKAQNGYHYNRPTGSPFSTISNNLIPNNNQKLSDIYQPQGSQTSNQNELSPSGYQYNRPSFKYSTTLSPQSPTIGFPRQFRPNSGTTAQALYTTTASPFSGNTNPTTYRGIVGAESAGTTSNLFISGETSEDKITAITSSPLNSRGSLGAGTSTITSSPLNAYSTSLVSSNGNYNYQTPATSLTPNRDYGNYQPGSDINIIPGTGFDYGSNNQFGSNPRTQKPSGFSVEHNNNIAAGSQLGSQGYNDFDSGTAGDLGTSSGYSGYAATSNPISGNLIPAGSHNQRPGTSNTGSYDLNSATGFGPSDTYNKNPESSDIIGSNVGNTGIFSSNKQYNENLIPQGNINFSPGAIGSYGPNIHVEDSQTQRPNSFSIGNIGASGSNNAYGVDPGSQRQSNSNDDDSSIKRPSVGYGGSSGLTGSGSGGANNFESNNAFGGLTNNQDSGNLNMANLGISGPNNGYGNNFGVQETNNDFLGNPATNKPNTSSSGNSGDPYHGNTFKGNLGQHEPNNAIEGSSGSQSLVYTSAGNQGSQNPINILESGTGSSGSSNTFGGSGVSQGFGNANTGNPGNIGPNFSATARPQKPDDSGSGENGDYSAIPGTPDLDYPILSEIPPTKFNCDSQKYPGYYADTDARCQVFHICTNGLKYDFLCPNGTVFHQRYFVCVWWNQFECNSAESFYNLNENLYDHDKIGSLIATAAGVTGAQGPSVTYTPGFGLLGSSSNFNPSTGPPESLINSIPYFGFEGPIISYGSSSQMQGPSSHSGDLAGPQGPSTSIISFSSYGGQLPNYNSSNQQQGSIPNTGYLIRPQGFSSSFGSSTGPQSSSRSFTPSFGYERPSTKYNYLGQSQSQLSNFGSSTSAPGQSVDYGTLNNPPESSNNYGQFSGPGGVSVRGSPSSTQESPSAFGSSPDLQGSSASYPGYQELRPSAGVGSFSTPQSSSVTYGPYSPPQNSVANFESSEGPSGVTNKGGPPLSLQESVNYEPSHESQSFSNNLRTSNGPLGLSDNFRKSTRLQGPGSYYGPTSTSQSSYKSSGGLSESSANLGQIGGPKGFTSTKSALTSSQESKIRYGLPSVPQTFSGNENPLAGTSISSDNYQQSSSFQRPSSDYGPPSNSQTQSSIYKPLSTQSPDYQSLSGLQVQLQNIGSLHNSPETLASFAIPAGSFSSSINYSHSSIPDGSSAGLDQQSNVQKPSPSYGPPLGPSSNFGQQRLPSGFDSTLNPQRPFSGYSSTPNPTRQSTFGQPSVPQITSASFSPLSSQPSSNYGAPIHPSGSIFGSNFGDSQGSSPAPFTLSPSSQRPPTIYGPSQSSALSTSRPQLNDSPSGVNHQQSDFNVPVTGHSSSLNNEQSQNYPTTVGLSHPFNTSNTEQPPNYSHSGYSSTAMTSPDSFSSPFPSLSTAQLELYNTESNVPSNIFSVQESSYPGYDRENTLHNNAPFSSSNQQVIKPNREYLPPFRKR